MAPQHWDPDTYARNAAFVPALGRDVLALLAPRKGERVLDLGCGDGVLTEQLAQAGCSVVGIDSSVAQVAAARARGLDARVARAESLSFSGEFDAVFSNAALHWIRAADAVVDSVHRALRPGGRFVGELGASGNVETIRHALRVVLEGRGVDAAALDPWLFPTQEWYRELLERHGFEVVTMLVFPRPTVIPTDMTTWLETFAQSFLAAFGVDERREVMQEVCAAVQSRLYEAGRGWTVDYVRLRFAAIRADTA